MHSDAVEFADNAIRKEAASSLTNTKFVSHLQICGLQGEKGKQIRIVIPITAGCQHEADECMRQSAIQVFRMDVVPFSASITALGGVHPKGHKLADHELQAHITHCIVYTKTLDAELRAASRASATQTPSGAFEIGEFELMEDGHKLNNSQLDLFFRTWLMKMGGKSDAACGLHEELDINVVEKPSGWEGGALSEILKAADEGEFFGRIRPSVN